MKQELDLNSAYKSLLYILIAISGGLFCSIFSVIVAVASATRFVEFIF